MVTWLSGMKEVGEPTWTPDGICNLTMEVTLQQVITELKRLHKTYYQGDKIRQADFDQILVHTEEKTEIIAMAAERSNARARNAVS